MGSHDRPVSSEPAGSQAAGGLSMPGRGLSHSFIIVLCGGLTHRGNYTEAGAFPGAATGKAESKVTRSGI